MYNYSTCSHVVLDLFEAISERSSVESDQSMYSVQLTKKEDSKVEEKQ